MREFWERKEVNGKEFYYIKMGKEDHGKPSFILWVNPKLIDKSKGYIEFPINATLVKGVKDYILKPTNDPRWVFNVYVECGLNGRAEIKVLSPYIQKVDYLDYRSPRGSVGINKGALIETDIDYVKIKFWRTGRTYGRPKEGILIYKLDGSVEELPSGIENDALLSLDEGGE